MVYTLPALPQTLYSCSHQCYRVGLKKAAAAVAAYGAHVSEWNSHCCYCSRLAAHPFLRYLTGTTVGTSQKSTAKKRLLDRSRLLARQKACEPGPGCTKQERKISTTKKGEPRYAPAVGQPKRSPGLDVAAPFPYLQDPEDPSLRPSPYHPQHTQGLRIAIAPLQRHSSASGSRKTGPAKTTTKM